MFAMHEVHSASSDANKYNYRRIPNNIIETFAVDAISDIIYFVDSSSGSLKKHDIISQKTSTIASVSVSARGNLIPRVHENIPIQPSLYCIDTTHMV